MTHACAHCGGRVADEAERCPSCGSAQRVRVGTGAPRAPAGQSPAARRSGRLQAAILLAGVGLTMFGGVCAGVAMFAGMPMASKERPTTPTTPDDVRTTTTVGATTEGGFAAVRARGKLRVAADPDAAPFLSKTAAGWEGFEYGVMSALAAEAGVPLEIVPATFSTLRDQLKSGAADLVIGQVSPSYTDAEIAYSISYLQYSLCLVVTAASPVRTLADLRGKRVGMYEDPVATKIAAVGIGASYERVTFDDYGYFDQLAQGKLDAVAYDCPLARHELRPYGAKLRIADDALNVATYNAAFRAGDPTLGADVNRVLKSLGDQGLLARLETQWLGGAAPAEGYATTAGKVVVVRRGDTLRTLAARELGSEARWAELHEGNRDLLGDAPEGIYQGLRLRLGKNHPGSTPAERRRPRRHR